MGPNPIRLVSVRKAASWTQTGTQTGHGDTPREAEGTDWGDAFVSQELQRRPANRQELGGRHGTDSPPWPPKEPTLPTLDLILMASRAERIDCCCFGLSVWGTFSQRP